MCNRPSTILYVHQGESSFIMTSASIYTDEAPDEHRGCTDETRCHTRYSRNASVQPDFRLIEAFRCAVGRSGAVLLAGRRRTQAI